MNKTRKVKGLEAKIDKLVFEAKDADRPQVVAHKKRLMKQYMSQYKTLTGYSYVPRPRYDMDL